MAKKPVGIIKLQIQAGKASPQPPVGPALGSRGLNIMEFCKAFNADTASLEPGTPVPVQITAYEDRTFTYVARTAPTSFMLTKAAGLEKGSAEPNRNKVGKVTLAQVREIADKKLAESNAVEPESVMRSVMGTARSMGIEIVE